MRKNQRDRRGKKHDMSASTAIVVSDYDPLIVLDEIEHKLASIPRIEEAIAIMDQADALRRLVRHATKGFLAQNKCSYIKLLAQRRAGELLGKIERSNPGESKAGKKDIGIRATLAHIEIAPTTAKRWQQLATLPPEAITKEWQKANAAGQELTEIRVHTLVGGTDAAERSGDPAAFYKRVWQGMPEFTLGSNQPVQKIVVNFETREDVEKFEKLIGQRLTDKTDSIWFPYKGRNNMQGGLVYVDEDETY